MRILFVAHYFQPEPNFFFGLPFARELVNLGHEVEVLTGFPNYPGGKIYDGYHVRFLQKENMEGIPIIRVPLYPSHDRSSIKRSLSYLSLSLSQAAIGPLVVSKADVAYVTQGPATVGLPGCVLRVVRRIPFVYNIQDLWPDTLIATGMFNSRLGLKLVDMWCKFVYKFASKIVVITPGMKQELYERGVSEDKIEVIYNWCDESQIQSVKDNPALSDELGLSGCFNIIFAGNMGKLQSMVTVLEAAKILQPEDPKIQFVLIGGGVEVDSLKQKAADMNLKNVLFLKRRPISEIGAILRLADVLFVHLKDEPLFRITIPSKTQAYMAIGRPILVGVKGDATDLVTKATAGLSCEPENPRSIADAVRQFRAMSRAELNAMGANGKRFYEQELSFKIGTKKFEKIFEAVAKRSRRTN